MTMISEVKPKLNSQQLQAIKHGDGPLLIIAGAGTGKTTVITERIAYLIKKEFAKPDQILALTFTEKAAREMEARVDVLLPYGYTNMWISTFHAFCDRILRREALQIGMDPKYKLMTTAETVQLIRRNFFKFKLKYFRPLGNPYKFIDGLMQHFARLQDENITPEEYLRWTKKKNNFEKLEQEKWEELANAYRTYEELKVKESVMDYGDLMVKTIKLFKDRPNVLAEYQKQFKYILIDEFQDTNYAQNELAMLLSKKLKNITVVGDDDQSIYRFRGAAISNIVQFRKNFPKASVVALTRNYRSVQEVLDRSYDLIQHNNPDRLEVVEKIDKKLKADRKEHGDVEFIRTSRVEYEAEEVAKEVKKLSRKYDFKDFAILVRANNHAEPFIRAFQRAGIPYQFLGPGRLFRQAEVVDLISYLRVLYDFDDSTSFWRILSLPFFEISARDLAKMGNHARKNNLSLFEAGEPPSLDALASQGKVSEDTHKKISEIVKIIYKHLGLIRKESAGQILYYFLQDTGILPKLLENDTVEAQKRANNISKFFDKLKTYEVDHSDATVPAVVDWIDLSMEVGESPAATDTDWSEINAVNILTVHSAKGLEFPVVFLVNLVSQRFPTIERREQIPIPEKLIREILPTGDYHLQEERRLFYVGMTRAKDFLYLTAANFYGEAKREKKISPFVVEAMGEFKIQNSKLKVENHELGFQGYKVDEKIEKIKLGRLSYSQIETFNICPLHFKLKYIDQIPPSPSASQSFGISIHKTLNNFYKGKKLNKGYMLKLLEENWIREGYETKEHERESYEKAKQMLTNFFEKYFDKNKKPKLMEYEFEINITHPDDPKRKLKIEGQMDRVDLLAQASGKIEIIDYKTGSHILSQRQVDGDFQMSFYALAASLLKEKPFGKSAEDISLTLYYLDTGEKVTTKRTARQLENIKRKIFQMKDEIENSSFRCSDGIICQNCEYKLICKSEYQ